MSHALRYLEPTSLEDEAAHSNDHRRLESDAVSRLTAVFDNVFVLFKLPLIY